MHGRILIVDDDQSMCEMLSTSLKGLGFSPSWYTSAQEALDNMHQQEFDVLLSDLNMPMMTGLDLCKRVTADFVDLPVIIITAFGSMDSAIEAIRAGAYDFVTKPIDVDLLAINLGRAVQHRELTRQVKSLSQEINKGSKFGDLIGESPVMRKLFTQLCRVSSTDTSVLITGESGTGKELVAKALHYKGARASKPFVPINCAALPEMLLESELFGHKRGAFTDAKSDRDGLFRQADGGTLFLDEIGDFPIALQPKLLRALEERRVRPLGGNNEIEFDARIIAATNHPLEEEQHKGHFREDLFYRLSVIQLELPPLRKRGSDVLLLAKHFLNIFSVKTGKKNSGMTNPVAQKLLAYNWPGNVRELKNVMERALALTSHEKIVLEDLPVKQQNYQSTKMQIGNNAEELVPLAEVEQRYIMHVLETVGGNRTQASKILGLDRKTLYRKLQT